MIARALDGVLSVLLAPQCAACARVLDAPLAGPVCTTCWNGVQPCHATLERWRSAGHYDGSLREIIHAFKYSGRRSLAAPLAALMREHGADLLATADVVVPVPLHPWRRLQRGFNQSDDLARHLDKRVCQALWRTRATVPQTGLGNTARHRNVRAAFRLSPLVRSSRIEGLHILLVDDVRTTGATLEACARVLERAGAASVGALTVARATLPEAKHLPPCHADRRPDQQVGH
jgi:ComF family protein